jgi:hypothetical protein
MLICQARLWDDILTGGRMKKQTMQVQSSPRAFMMLLEEAKTLPLQM